jgi:hypothetical protein
MAEHGRYVPSEGGSLFLPTQNIDRKLPTPETESLMGYNLRAIQKQKQL